MSTYFSPKDLEDLSPRQAEILEAAVRVFSKKGYDGSRTKEIAKEAGVSEATLFKHFPSKRSLLTAVMKPFVETVMKPMMMDSVRQILNARGGKPIEEVLESVMFDRIALIRRRGPLIVTLLSEAIRRPEILEVVRTQAAPDVLDLLDGVFAPALDRGEIRNLDTKLLGRTFLSVVIGYLALGELMPEHFRRGDDEKEIRDMIDLLMHGIAPAKGNE